MQPDLLFTWEKLMPRNPPPTAVPTLREAPIQIVIGTMSAYSPMFNNKLRERECAREHAKVDETER
jgi:hypothetical protein